MNEIVAVSKKKVFMIEHQVNNVLIFKYSVAICDVCSFMTSPEMFCV